MAATIILTVTDGVGLLKEYEFRSRTLWTVGRAKDCQLELPSDTLHWSISRYHCRLDIDPPVVRVRDLGSRNGTFVNGRNIGQREGATVGESILVSDLPEVEVQQGDQIRVGSVTLQITLGTADDAVANPPGEPQQQGPFAPPKPLTELSSPND